VVGVTDSWWREKGLKKEEIRDIISTTDDTNQGQIILTLIKLGGGRGLGEYKDLDFSKCARDRVGSRTTGTT